MTATEQKIIEIVAKVYNKDIADLTADTLLNSLSSSSVLMMGMLSTIEDELDVELNSGDILGDITLGGVARLVEAEME